VPGHQKGVKFETWGNYFTDETEKQAALTSEVLVFCPILHLPAPPITSIFTPPEEELKKLGAIGPNRENGFSLTGGKWSESP
jgi:hypothetical protein